MPTDLDGDFVLRRADFDLSEEQQDLQDALRAMFSRAVPSERVRKAEPLGHDPDLWAELAENRIVAMGISEDAGGDGAGLPELGVLAEEAGRVLAPVPLLEAVVATRLLAASTGAAVPEAVLSGDRIGAIALQPDTTPQLVAAGAVADFVLWHLDGATVVQDDEPRPAVANLGTTPVAWCEPTSGSRTVADGGPTAAVAFERARREWRVLAAAMLAGMGEAVLDQGVQYAKERRAFGAPIGSFQGLSHPLANAAVAVAGSRRLARKAAWFLEHEPEEQAWLPSMAFVAASRAAEEAATTALQVQGGLGFTLESDVQLYLRRIKTLSLLTGDTRRELQTVADLRYGKVAH